jgi:hypothetical protein
MVRFGAKEVPLDVYRRTLALGLTRSAQFSEAMLPEDATTAVRPILPASAAVSAARRSGPEPTN